MIWFHNSSSLRYIARVMGELISGSAWAIWQYVGLFRGCSEEKDKITEVMEEVVFVHGLASRTNMEISSPWSLSRPSLLHIILSNCTFCSLPTFILILMKEIFWEKKSISCKWFNVVAYSTSSSCNTLIMKIYLMYVTWLVAFIIRSETKTFLAKRTHSHIHASYGMVYGHTSLYNSCMGWTHMLWKYREQRGIRCDINSLEISPDSLQLFQWALENESPSEAFWDKQTFP